MNQKFLDAEGVKHLWSKISMEDYPNNKTLMAVINAIDETKADKSELIQSDWNQNDESKFDFIKNRTHYSVTRDETITLSIDGNIDGLEIVESKTNTSVQYVKVSNSPIEVNDMRNASLVLLETSGNEVLYDDLDSRIVVDDSTGSYVVNPFVFVFLNDTTTDDGNFTKGVWFTCGKNPANIKMSLTYTIQVNEIKKIDPKFLPYDIATDDEIIAMFMEEDMFPAVADADGSVLADENNNILLW